MVQDELAKAEMPVNIAVHTIASHYILDFGTEAQKQRWLPKVTNGEMLAAIAMTEPGCGSDLKAISTRARRDGDYYVMVRESSYRGSSRSFYRLHVGEFRRPDVVFPAGGKAGSKVDVRFLDAFKLPLVRAVMPACAAVALARAWAISAERARS